MKHLQSKTGFQCLGTGMTGEGTSLTTVIPLHVLADEILRRYDGLRWHDDKVPVSAT